VKKEEKAPNFLDFIPEPLRKAETDGEGIVTVYVPRFGSGRLGRILTRIFRSKDITVRLDSVGSFVWNRCDGHRSLFSIGTEMKESFGEEVEPVFDRLVLFIRQMERGKLIHVRNREPLQE